jgi:hypothetical protein
MLTLLIAVVLVLWLLVVIAAVGLCRAAAKGDADLRAASGAPAVADRRDRPSARTRARHRPRA